MSTVATRRFTVDEFYRMAETGVLRPDERVELIEGAIVEMNPIGRRHAGHVNRLGDRLRALLGERALVTVQNPVLLSDVTSPQPDLAVVARRSHYYTEGHPQPVDIYVAIEVADSSLAYDRDVKAPLYARSGVPELWIVEVAGPLMQVHRDPGPDRYRSVTDVAAGDTITIRALPDLELDVAGLIG